MAKNTEKEKAAEQATEKVKVTEQATEKVTAGAAEEVAAPKHPAKVKIKIPFTRTEKDDVLVALNGKTYQIKRGHEVEVPWGVSKILERKEKQLLIAMQYEEMAAQGLDGLEKN